MAQELDGTEPVNIKVFGLISEAYGFVKANSNALFQLSIVPFLVTFLITIFAYMWPMGGFSETLSEIIQFGVMVLYAVAVHRFYLLHEKPQLHLRRCELRFGLYSAAVLVGGVGAGIILGVILALTGGFFSYEIGMFIVDVVAVFIGFYVFLRVGLIFPAAAVSYPGRFLDLLKMSWKTMRRSMWALLGAMFILGIIIGLVALIPYALVSKDVLGVVSYPMIVLVAAFFAACTGLAFNLFTVLFVSICFKKLFGFDAGPAQEAGLVEQ